VMNGMHGWMMAGMGFLVLLVVLTLIAVLVVAVLGSVWLVRRLRAGDTDT
jgi:ABC-type thiamin/hydroxymethylpyrimidine transport system permease subunit